MKHIVSYPRSGSTYMRFLIANALQKEPVTFDNIDHLIPEGRGPLGWKKSHRAPRFLWFPVPWDGVLLVRDPKSVAISYHRYQVKMGQTVKFFDDWLEEWVLKGDKKWGRWNEHLAESREHCYGVEVRYEDLVSHPQEILWLMLDSDRTADAVRLSSFDQMRKLEVNAKKQMGNTAIPFVRKGLVDEWKNLRQDQIDFIDKNLL